MVQNSVPHLSGEIQTSSILLQNIHRAQRLLVVPKSLRAYPVQNTLPGMTERRMPEIVAECYRLRQILVQPERPRNGPCDL